MLNLFHSGNMQTGTLTNSDDRDKMPHNADLQGIVC